MRVHFDLGTFGAARLLRVLLAATAVPIILLDRGAAMSAPLVASLLAVSLLAASLSLPSVENRPGVAVPQVALDILLALSVSSFVDARATPLIWLALLVPAMTAGHHFGAGVSVAIWTGVSFAFAGISFAFSPNDYSDIDVLRLVIQQVFASVAIVGSVVYVMRRNWAAFRQVASDQKDATQRLRHLISIGDSATLLAEAEEPDAVVRETIAASLHNGFDRAELWLRSPDGWQLLGSGGGLPADDVALRSLLQTDLTPRLANRVTLDDLDPEIARALYAAGYTSAVLLPLATRSNASLRLIGFNVDAEDGRQQIDSIELIGGHVSTAWNKSQRIQELDEWAKQLGHQALHDQLTGLPNRAGFSTQVKLGGPDSPILLFFDLNGFKAVNDKHGHDAGDALLRGISASLEPLRQRPGHFVARFGGDEFVLSAPATADVEQLCADIIIAVEQPVRVGGQLLEVGTSIGVALPTASGTIDDQLRRADEAMYVAKQRKHDGSAWSLASEQPIIEPRNAADAESLEPERSAAGISR